MTKIFRGPAALLTALYTLAWGPMLFMRGTHWDGWLFFAEFAHKNFAAVWAICAPVRKYHHYYMFRVLEATPDPALAARAITFFSWLFAGLLLFRILRSFLGWRTSVAAIVTAYFLIFPTFIVRFEIIHTYYSLSALFFAAACYLYLTPDPRTWFATFIREIGAATLLILAFLVNSFLVFFFGFLGVHAYLFATRRGYSSLRDAAFAYARRYWYLILSPFAFMAQRLWLFPPYDWAADNNRLIFLDPSAAVVMKLIEGMWGGFWASFIWPLQSALQLLERKYFLVALIVAGALVLVLVRRLVQSEEYDVTRAENVALSWFRQLIQRPYTVMFVSGCVFIILALFPYVAVDQYPHVYGYGFGLRHSLLTPLGSALIFVSLIGIAVRNEWQRAVHISLFSLFTALLWFNFFLADMDWYKQNAIMAELAPLTRDIPPTVTFVFTDDATQYNWLNRQVSRTDYSGYLRYLTGTNNYRGVSAYDFIASPTPEELAASTTVQLRIISERGNVGLRVTEWAHLKWIELTESEEALRSAASETLKIRFRTNTPYSIEETL